VWYLGKLSQPYNIVIKLVKQKGNNFYLGKFIIYFTKLCLLYSLYGIEQLYDRE
jgi:hypothetical protein